MGARTVEVMEQRTPKQDQAFWDELYTEREHRWSGRVNGGLRVEAEGMEPGRALDLGCGEGADAIWLADKGWKVTAVDISPVALERAAAAAGPDSGIDWQQTDVTVAPPTRRGFDLVSAQYFPVLREEGHTALRGLIDAVAPGGTLLVVSHLIEGPPPPEWSGPDPREFYRPAEIAELLDEDWAIEISGARARVDAPEGHSHHADTVLRARRLR